MSYSRGQNNFAVEINEMSNYLSLQLKISTEVGPGTFFTVSGTAQMVPVEDLNVHIGTKQRGIAKCLQDIVTKVPGLLRSDWKMYKDRSLLRQSCFRK